MKVKITLKSANCLTQTQVAAGNVEPTAATFFQPANTSTTQLQARAAAQQQHTMAHSGAIPESQISWQ
jgi:hypothetical protein